MYLFIVENYNYYNNYNFIILTKENIQIITKWSHCCYYILFTLIVLLSYKKVEYYKYNVYQYI